jgi:hypothetical protein
MAKEIKPSEITTNVAVGIVFVREVIWSTDNEKDCGGER